MIGDTDSTFNKLDTTHHEKNCHKLAYSMMVGSYVAAKITKYLRSLNTFRKENEKWTNLQYEKVYLELLLLAKKRYVGSLYDFNPYKKNYIDKKGVALKRRDYCKFVQDVFRDVLKCFFDDNVTVIAERITNAQNIVIDNVKDLLDNKVPFDKLILSKLLKDKYKVRDQKCTKGFNEKNIFVEDIITYEDDDFGLVEAVVRKKHTTKFDSNAFFGNVKSNQPSNTQQKPLEVYIRKTVNKKVPPSDRRVVQLNYSDIKQRMGYEVSLSKIMDPKTKESEIENVSQPHARLARKMYMRDPGSAPSSGARLQFMFVESKDPNAKQWTKAEDPEYVQKNGLKPDPVYYLEHQLKKPMIQLFELVMKDPESLFREPMRKYRNKQVGQTDITSFFKK